MTGLLVILFSIALVACTDSGIEGQSDNPKQVEIVSVKGPLEPINPGGPVIGITLKNTSDNNIVSLNAILELVRPFSYEFDVSTDNPLLPNNTIYLAQILINGGIADDTSYPLEISGTFQDGTTFSYTEQVMIEDD